MLINSIKKDSPAYHLLLKILRFAIVGGLSTLINYGSFAFLYKIIGLYYLLSSIIGYILGLLTGYALNKNWTFIAQVDENKSYLLGYFIVYIASLILSQLLLLLLVEKIGIVPLVANIFAIMLSTILNFLGANFFVFKKDKGFELNG